MTISSTVRKTSPYIGDDASTEFAFAFKVFSTADVYVVKQTTATGAETVLVLSTDYSVTLNANQNSDPGGVVTLVDPLADGYTLVISSNVSPLQTTDLTNQGGFYPQVVTNALDKLTILIQQIIEKANRSLSFPITETEIGELPSISERSSKVLAFDADGGLVAQADVPTSGVLATAAAETLLDDTSVGAMRTTLGVFGADWVFAPLYGVDMTGATDSSTELQAAIDAAAGKPVYVPAGTVRLDSKVSYVTDSADVFVPGLKLIGAGRLLTYFDTRVAGDACIAVDTDTTNKFQAGVEMRGFSVITNSAPANGDGLYLRRAYHVSLYDVSIYGLSRDGLVIEVNEGDGDASNMVYLKHVRIENCARWGIHADMGTGINELSFLQLDHTFIQSCGTTSGATPPPSGGMKWRGQVLDLDNSAFVTNENVGLYVVGGAGLGNTLSCDATAFENNKVRHVLIEGLDGGAFRNIQLYSNDTFIANYGIRLDGTSSTIRNILIDGVIVRATSGNNSYTAFSSTGGQVENKSVEVANVSWSNFDHAGQTRYDSSFIRDEVQTWTPVLTFDTPGDLSVSYSTQLGKYRRTRDGMVHVSMDLVTSAFTHTTASGVLKITGLPFIAENTTGLFALGAVQWQGITKTNYTDITARIDPNTNFIVFQMSGSGQAVANLVAGDMPTGGSVVLRLNISYKAAT